MLAGQILGSRIHGGWCWQGEEDLREERGKWLRPQWRNWEYMEGFQTFHWKKVASGCISAWGHCPPLRLKALAICWMLLMLIQEDFAYDFYSAQERWIANLITRGMEENMFLGSSQATIWLLLRPLHEIVGKISLGIFYQKFLYGEKHK